MIKPKRLISLFGALTFTAGLVAQLVAPAITLAATTGQITTRSLTLQDGAGGDGGSLPSGKVNHLFQFTAPSATAVNTITFTYCTTAAPVTGGIQCDAPGGLDASTATLGLDGGTGWTITNQTANTVTVSGTAIASPGLQGAKTFRLDGVTNPSAANTTFFVRIATEDSTGPTTVDTGTVAASTASAIQLSGTMPESLVFCTGATISLTSGVPDCTTATSGVIGFNQLFSPTSTSYATSQMAASTNAGQGYAITVGGPTLTSGSNTIAPMTATDTSKFGISQFGMNLTLNDGSAYTNAPNIPSSADISPTSNGANYNAEALTGFNTTGYFTFNNAALNAIADSTAKGTDSQIYTASYIVNVPGSLPAGTYSTTLTYICTPTF